MKQKIHVPDIIQFIFMFLIISIMCISLVNAAEDNGDIPDNGAIPTTSLTNDITSMILEPGWNFISVPKRLASGENSAMIFSALNSDGRSIWTYESDGTSSGSWITLSATDKISPLNGYWVYSVNPAVIKLSYSQDPLTTPPLRDLQTGWNAIGFASLTPATARDALLSAKKSWIEIIGFDAESQVSLPAILNGGGEEHSDRQYLTPMQGYWCLVSDPCMYAALTA